MSTPVNLSRVFIERPVATLLLAAAIVLCGLLAVRMLPVAPLPQVDYPAISINASLPGASPESMAATVATPLERALGTIPGPVSYTHLDVYKRQVPGAPPERPGRRG